MTLRLTFVNQYGDITPKRRRLAKACESCRARKKRCVHFADEGDKDKDNPTASDEGGEASTSIPSGRPDDDAAPSPPATLPASSNSHPRQSSNSNYKRFISDLNPEATFLQPAQGAAQKDARSQNDDIGIWVDKREYDALVRQKNRSREDVADSSPHNHRPHPDIVAPLVDVYFGNIHHVLPLLDEAEFRTAYTAGHLPDALVHAVCLVAAKHTDAAPHLRLDDSTAVLAPREFSSKLHASVIAALRVPANFEKIMLIRTLALTSLHAEGPEGAEEATMCLNQAMHYTQTLGWHLGQHTGVASSDDLTTKRLFWCLWSLDRINSCIYGRPIMMSDIDIAIESFEPGESGFPAFEVWLYLCRTLNKIIGFYRPGTSLAVTGWEDDFPSFEDAMDQGKAWHLDRPTLATLHLFYLLVAVLSHRSRGVKSVCRSTPSYVRQSLCAIELNRLMSSPLFPSLLPLPILPYAISLALSVSYQHLRQSQLQHQQEDARQDFRACFEVLQKLRRTWSSADVIATIARKVLAELEKAPDLAVFRVSKVAEEGRDSPHICTASFWKPHTIIDHPTTDTAGGDVDEATGNAAADVQPPPVETDWLGLFEGMDDIFGTYLDPNYPLNLDDFSFVDDQSPREWG